MQILQEQCVLINKLIRKDLQIIILLTVKELKYICAQLSVQEGTKDEIVKRLLLVLLNEDSFDIDYIVIILNSIKK